MSDEAASTAKCNVCFRSVAFAFRDGAKWSVEQYDSASPIEIPARAEWVDDRGVFSWTEPHATADRRCDACASGAPCIVRIEVAPDMGTSVFTHVAPDVALRVAA